MPAGSLSTARPAEAALAAGPVPADSAGLRIATALPAPPPLEPLSRITRSPLSPRSAPRAAPAALRGHARSAEVARRSGGV